MKWEKVIVANPQRNLPASIIVSGFRILMDSIFHHFEGRRVKKVFCCLHITEKIPIRNYYASLTISFRYTNAFRIVWIFVYISKSTHFIRPVLILRREIENAVYLVFILLGCVGRVGNPASSIRIFLLALTINMNAEFSKKMNHQGFGCYLQEFQSLHREPFHKYNNNKLKCYYFRNQKILMWNLNSRKGAITIGKFLLISLIVRSKVNRGSKKCCAYNNVLQLII